MKEKVYSYYLTQRPAGPGCQPREGLIRVMDLSGCAEEGECVRIIGRSAYSRVDYDRPLTAKEVRDYELTPLDRPQTVKYKGFLIEWIESMNSWRICRENQQYATVAYEDSVDEAKVGIDAIMEVES